MRIYLYFLEKRRARDAYNDDNMALKSTIVLPNKICSKPELGVPIEEQLSKDTKVWDKRRFEQIRRAKREAQREILEEYYKKH